MAVILKFPTEARLAAAPAETGAASAEILFFTGVRYERPGSSATRKPPRRQRRRAQRRTKSA